MKKNMDVKWGYTGETGPEHWADLCDWFKKGAEFPLQSPIALTTATADSPLTEGKEAPITFHYQRQRFTDKEFKNTIHLVPYDQLSYLVYQGERFYLNDIHFHMPSEHIIDGEHEDIEFHFVHMSKKGENLVVGVMAHFEQGGWCFDRKNNENWNLASHEHWFDPIIFLPEVKSHFHYVGSLTTPPTSGPIQWFVMDRIGKVDARFLEPFKGQYAQPNNRPLQPLKERSIEHFKGADE